MSTDQRTHTDITKATIEVDAPHCPSPLSQRADQPIALPRNVGVDQ
ncbi:MAG: hypothetical protein GY832_45440 [Chloroflexi bacterium]|nr:hypothetical protein [Chloroflexota bacterium]